MDCDRNALAGDSDASRSGEAHRKGPHLVRRRRDAHDRRADRSQRRVRRQRCAPEAARIQYCCELTGAGARPLPRAPRRSRPRARRSCATSLISMVKCFDALVFRICVFAAVTLILSPTANRRCPAAALSDRPQSQQRLPRHASAAAGAVATNHVALGGRDAHSVAPGKPPPQQALLWRVSATPLAVLDVALAARDSLLATQ